MRMASSAGSTPRRRSAVPGVLAVYTAADLAAGGIGPLPARQVMNNRDGTPMLQPVRYALATDKVRHVGEAVAAVIGDSLAAAKDGAEAVELDIEPLPAVTEPAEADAPGAPQLYDDVPNNVGLDFHFGDSEAVSAAFARGGACHKDRAAQQPHRRQPDRAARRAGRIRPRHRAFHGPCRQSGRVRVPQLHRRRARRRARQNAGTDRPGRRLVRHEAAEHVGIFLHAARGARTRAAGQMDRRSLRQLCLRYAWPRPRHDRRAGARRRGQFPRRAAYGVRQSRRDLRRARPLDAQRAAQHARRLPDAADRGEHEMRVHQHDAGRGLSRRRAARGQLLYGAAGRYGGARNRDRPGRTAPQEPHPPRGHAVQGAERHDLRQRRFHQPA